MLATVYILTLLVPLVMSFFLDDMSEGEEFFSLFSLNKVMMFLNGYLLGLLCNVNIAFCILSGLFHLGIYILAMTAVKTLEYTSKKREVEVGETGMAYTTIGDELGKVLIAGELYLAVTHTNEIPSFTPIKVVDRVPNSDILIVDIRL